MLAAQRRSGRWTRAAVLALSLLGVGSLSGCRGCQRNEQQPAKAIVQRVPLPATALAEITVPEPSRVWTALRDLTGGRFIAANLEMQLAETLELSPLAAGAFVVQSPIRGVILQNQSTTSPTLVWSVRLKGGAELETLLTKGSQAAFTSQRLPSGETLLNPKQPSVTRQLAVLGNVLIVAPSREPLLVASHYLTQSFPQASANAAAPAPYVEVTFKQRGLRELSEPLRQAWQAQRANLALLLDQQTAAKGRPADYADPASVLQLIGQQVQETLDLVGGLSGVAVRLNEQQGTLVLEMALEATANSSAQKWLAGFTQGQPPPWAQLSNKSRVVLSHTIGAAEGQPEQEATWGSSIAQRLAGLLGERVSSEDLARIEKAFTTLRGGLGTSCTWGWLQVDGVEGGGAEQSGALFLVTRVRDAAAFKLGLANVLELHSVPALRNIATNLLDGARLSPLKLGVAGDAVEGYQVLRTTPEAQNTRVLWTVHGELGYLVVGPAAESALRELLIPSQTLGDQPELQSVLGQAPSGQRRAVPSTALLGYGNAPGLSGVVVFGSIASTKTGAEVRLQLNRAVIQSALPWLGLLLVSP